MDLKDLQVQAGRVEEGPPEELAFRLCALGEDVEAYLSDPAALTEVSRRIVRIAHSLNCEAVAGASSVGERMAGAASALSGSSLRVFAGQESGRIPDRVLLVDGLFVTGTQLSWLASQLM